MFSAPENSLSWAAYFSGNCCENGSEADSNRPGGGSGLFLGSVLLAAISAVVIEYRYVRKVKEYVA